MGDVIHTLPALTDAVKAQQAWLNAEHAEARQTREQAETLLFSSEIKKLVNEKADLSVLREAAFKEGMKPLRISGAMKVGAGLTTIEEVLKVAPPVRDAA